MDKLDLLGRTSEMARLFGIDFFSVLSRGSQYRVEAVMLRYSTVFWREDRQRAQSEEPSRKTARSIALDCCCMYVVGRLDSASKKYVFTAHRERCAFNRRYSIRPRVS